MQNMEDMDIDQVVDVPDTPDRLPIRRIVGEECVGKDSNSSLASQLRNPDFLDEKCKNGLRGRGRLVNDNGHNRRLVIRSRKNLRNDETTGRNNSVVLSPLENSNASRNAHLFRRAAIDKSSSPETRHSIGTHDMDKGKGICAKFHSKSSHCQDDTADLDLTEQNGCTGNPTNIFPLGAFEDYLAENKKKEQIRTISGSSAYCIPDSSKASRNAFKGKEKLEDSTFKDLGLALALGKGADLSGGSQYKTEKQTPAPLHSVSLPRVTGQKRLVRNGCISPHNIATRAKQLAEQHHASSKNVEQSHAGNMVPDGSHCLIDINDMVSEDNNSDRVKGKGVLIHPFTSKQHGAKNIGTTGSSPVINNEEADGSSDATMDAFGCSEGLGGWRSTRGRSRKIDHPVSDAAGCLFSGVDDVATFVSQQHENSAERRDNANGINCRAQYDLTEDCGEPQTASKILSESDQIAGPHHAANKIVKRQKKHRLSSRNLGECSSSFSDDSDILFLGSSGQPSNSRSSRVRTRQHQGRLDPVIEVDELSPEMRETVSRGLDFMNNDDSDARARQVEADAMLALELQEQLYYEVPVVGGGEIDENLAWVLQQEEDGLRAASGRNHSVSHSRGSQITHSNRQPRLPSFQNQSRAPTSSRVAPVMGTRARVSPSNRVAQLMGMQARVPNSSRTPRLRGRLLRQSPNVSSTGRSLHFPLNMDLEMRLDILEALEAAVGDLSDMSMADHMHQVQRDFNENDYEMLLALDDNNHQHAGASVNQINCLPQSTVQTDTCEEACAICLEIPTIGETIRHLPCLHKFHKDCIDPWLSRRTSCPVCKCSIT